MKHRCPRMQQNQNMAKISARQEGEFSTHAMLWESAFSVPSSSGYGIRLKASATKLFLPGRWIISKSYSCNFRAHLSSRPVCLADFSQTNARFLPSMVCRLLLPWERQVILFPTWYSFSPLLWEPYLRRQLHFPGYRWTSDSGNSRLQCR